MRRRGVVAIFVAVVVLVAPRSSSSSSRRIRLRIRVVVIWSSSNVTDATKVVGHVRGRIFGKVGDSRQCHDQGKYDSSQHSQIVTTTATRVLHSYYPSVSSLLATNPESLLLYCSSRCGSSSEYDNNSEGRCGTAKGSTSSIQSVRRPTESEIGTDNGLKFLSVRPESTATWNRDWFSSHQVTPSQNRSNQIWRSTMLARPPADNSSSACKDSTPKPLFPFPFPP